MHPDPKWPRFASTLVAIGIVGLVVHAARPTGTRTAAAPERDASADDLGSVVEEVNAFLAGRWQAAGLRPAAPAPDSQVLRRLSLALHGAVPSLQEIREFEADRRDDRLDRWTLRMLADPRFSDYFAERLARAYVGKEEGQFILFRRDRFVDWLGQQLRRRTPYDQVVREMIAATGLMTGEPAVNFITAAIANSQIDENKLAGKTVRAFLGQRIDCAQCHDHPFDRWKQQEFAGLAAFYGQVRSSVVGIEDKTKDKGRPVEFMVEDRKDLDQRVVAPAAPFHPEWMPATGTRRHRLAAWITHPENRRFERAIANRIWALMFGKAYIEPVDDLGDPAEARDLLDILGQDFRAHDCDLSRLARVIASSAPFRLSSESGGSENRSAGQAPGVSSDPDDSERQRRLKEWAVFPLIRLRPEQVIGSLLQCSSIQTIDQNSHLLFRAKKFFQEGEFVREYGDMGEDELQDRGGTIPQRLLLMNGKLAAEAIAPNPLNASARIAALARTDDRRIEAAYLMCLTRRPSSTEAAWFSSEFATAPKHERNRALQDLIWSLLNSTEFSWNH